MSSSDSSNLARLLQAEYHGDEEAIIGQEKMEEQEEGKGGIDSKDGGNRSRRAIAKRADSTASSTSALSSSSTVRSEEAYIWAEVSWRKEE